MFGFVSQVVYRYELVNNSFLFLASKLETVLAKSPFCLLIISGDDFKMILFGED